MSCDAYHTAVIDLLNRIDETQTQALQQAAALIKKSIDAGNVVHIFSTGHSHMLVEEMFYRAGGLVPVNPIFDPGTMLHQGPQRSTQFERLPGYARVIFQNADTRPGEPIIIASNSGINPVPVEMALLAKGKGLPVIAITSCQISGALPSRMPSGQKLMDVADIILDNCVIESDAAIVVGPGGEKAGAFSTIAGAYLIQQLVLDVAAAFQKEGKVAPIFVSANVPGGDEWNAQLIEKYKGRISQL
jgi:uncharacterized phosphosugar-binding protein